MSCNSFFAVSLSIAWPSVNLLGPPHLGRSLHCVSTHLNALNQQTGKTIQVLTFSDDQSCAFD